MSKKEKTLKELKAHMDAAKKEYDLGLKKEREKIGAAVQAATGLDSAKEIFTHFDLVKKEA